MFGAILNLFGANKIIFIAVLLGAVAITSATGFTIMSYKSVLNNLIVLSQTKDKEINTLKEQVAGLTIDNSNLKLSNKTLTEKSSLAEVNLKKAIEEIDQINKSDIASSERISLLEKVIADQVRQDRITALREGRKSQLFLNQINKNVECWIDNFENTNGRCIAGKFLEYKK